MQKTPMNSEEGTHTQDLDRILIIDDDLDLRKLLIQRFTKSGLIVDEAQDIVTAKMKLYENVYDLILLDLVMYPDSGYILFDFLKSDPKLKWIPLIVLSGSDDVDDKVRCLSLGADDYVTKPFAFKELRARVLRLLQRAKEFEQLAFRDALTGVYNRRYFDSQLEIELHRIKRMPTYMTIALIDIDRFKTINDSFGHPVGDIVLQGVSSIIKDSIRQTDLLARYGGEEFIVLLYNTTEAEAVNVLERALARTREKEFVQIQGQVVRATFSAGVAAWDGELSEDDWVERADQLLYQAKEAGRNQIVCDGRGSVEEIAFILE